MAYNKHTWVARQGVGLNKFTDQNGNRYEFTPSPDEVTQPGTPFSAEWMNEMEEGIASAGIIYGICETAAATAAKIVDTGGAPEQLANGDNFRILFVNEVQAGATLNINGIGAYPIIDNYTGEAIVLGDISAGYVGDIVYEDGRFVLLNAVRLSATPQGYQMFTANGTFTVPAGVTAIRVSACAAGVKGNAGEWIENQVYNVTPGQTIDLTIGTGNTIIGELATLVAGSVTGASPSTKLGYATGYNGGTGGTSTNRCGSGKGGYGGRYGFGGGGGAGIGDVDKGLSGYPSAGGGGGVGGDGSDGEWKGSSLSSGAGGSGGGDTGGDGGASSKSSATYVTAGGDAKNGTLIYAGCAGTEKKGGSGSIYGAGGGGGSRYSTGGYGGGGGAGGYGAGGGQRGSVVTAITTAGSATVYGTPSNGMVLIEWGGTVAA